MSIPAVYLPAPGPAWTTRESDRLQSPLERIAVAVGACVAVGIGSGLGIRYGIAALAAAAAVLVVLRRPVLGALALVAIVPAASGLQPGLPVPGVRVTEVMIAGLASIVLITAQPGSTPPWRAFDWCALAYVVANAALGSFDLLHRGQGIHFADASKLLGPLQFFLLYRAALTALTTRQRRRTALRLILFASVPVAVLAVAQEVHVPGIGALLASVTGSTAFADSGSVRATGPFPHWHDLGAYLFIVVLLGVGLLSIGSDRVINRRALIAIVGLAVIGVVTTVSFTPISGVLVGSLLLISAVAGPQRRRRITTLVAFASALAIAFAPALEGRYNEQLASNTASTSVPFLPKNFSFRIDVWRTEYLPIVRNNLATGYGPNLPHSLEFAFTESVYMTLLLRGGLPLLLLYLGLMLALYVKARDASSSPDADARAVARVLRVVIVLIFFMQLATNYFVNAGFPYVFWLLAAILMASGRRPGVPVMGGRGRGSAALALR